MPQRLMISGRIPRGCSKVTGTDGETYLCGENLRTELRERDLELPSGLLDDYLDGDERFGPNGHACRHDGVEERMNGGCQAAVTSDTSAE